MAGVSPIATFGESLSERVRDIFDEITAWAERLGAIDFLLIAVVVWAIYWTISTLRGMTRLGPIEVSLLEYDGPPEAAPPVHALTALMRERLGKSGLLPPPEVPAGSPQTNLIAAIETSGHPQAAWAAALLRLLPHPPRPPQYTLSATLSSTKTQPSAAQHELRYWLKPKNEGRAQMETVRDTTTEKAICRAAADIFHAISADAVHVFPRWARWDDRNAFLTYMQGLDEQVAGRDRAAQGYFAMAACGEQRNPLPRLQLANLLEKEAAMAASANAAVEAKDAAARAAAGDAKPAAAAARDTASRDRYFGNARQQARVLRMYLDIGVECPSLVAARYRASIVAGVLASACKRPEDPFDEPRLRIISEDLRLLEPAPQLPDALEKIANRESKAALQLSRRFHVVVDKHRLRHRYEPRGRERRELLRAVEISRHARRIRQFGPEESAGPHWGSTWRRAVVRVIDLGLFRTSAGWNAHYNAGCFYALLLGRALEATPAAKADPARETRPIRTLRRRAYEELHLAVDTAGPELSSDWLLRGDRNLEILRKPDEPQWQLLVRRHTGQRSPNDPRLPEPAWGDPNRRRNEWFSGAVVLLLAAIPLWFVFESRTLLWIMLLAGVGALVATAVVHWEARVANRREDAIRIRAGSKSEARSETA